MAKTPPGPFNGINYMPSVLKDLPNVNELVSAQQHIEQAYCVMAVQAGELLLADDLAANFLSTGTCCQLYGFQVCFPDMTRIVRNRCAEVPFKMIGVGLYTALKCHGVTAKFVSKLDGNGAGNASKFNLMFLIYKTLLSSELLDSKKAEYFSDYCIYSVEQCLNFEGDFNVQPVDLPTSILQDDPARLQEKWIYEIRQPPCQGENVKYVRYCLRLTEDQRQIAVANDLNNDFNDDCESLAALIMAYQKKCAAAEQGFVECGLFTNTWQQTEESRKQFENILNMIFPAQLKTDPFHNTTYIERVDYLMALVNIMNQITFETSLCVGSAGAPARVEPGEPGEGGEKDTTAKRELNGHCYIGIKGTSKRDNTIVKYGIVEGTNFVEQKREADSKLVISLENFKAINRITTSLQELTKLQNIPLRSDIGKGGLISFEDGVKNQFYVTVYVFGECVMLLRLPGHENGTPAQTVYGCSIETIVNQPKCCGGVDNANTATNYCTTTATQNLPLPLSGEMHRSSPALTMMPVDYSLITHHLQVAGVKIKTGDLSAVVQGIAKVNSMCWRMRCMSHVLCALAVPFQHRTLHFGHTRSNNTLAPCPLCSALTLLVFANRRKPSRRGRRPCGTCTRISFRCAKSCTLLIKVQPRSCSTRRYTSA